MHLRNVQLQLSTPWRQNRVRRKNYGGTLAVLWHSLFAMSWPLLDLSAPKRTGVHADFTCNPAQDEWAALGKWHLQLNIIKKHLTREAGWSALLSCCLLHSFQGICNILDWLSFFSRWGCTIRHGGEVRQRWETETLPKIKLGNGD